MMQDNATGRPDLTRFAWMAIAAALATIALKTGAYAITGSVGLLSDAAESIVNLVAAIVALVTLRVAAQPHDAEHHFGHSKAEYFSAAVEGLMIFIAAVFIIYAAIGRLLHPVALENIGVGLVISVLASGLNGWVAFLLIRAGRSHRSATLVADGKHLLTDVWTSAGVVVGVLLVAVTGWLRMDPIIALLVGANIIWTGWHLISDSLDALMDRSLSDDEHERLIAVLEEFESPHVAFHHVRTRVAGHRQFIYMHVLVPGTWTVQAGHDVIERIETRLGSEFPDAEVMTHLEPREDPRSYESHFPGLPAKEHAKAPPTITLD
jgi:cation diffusion facilitator family transporter